MGRRVSRGAVDRVLLRRALVGRGEGEARIGGDGDGAVAAGGRHVVVLLRAVERVAVPARGRRGARLVVVAAAAAHKRDGETAENAHWAGAGDGERGAGSGLRYSGLYSTERRGGGRARFVIYCLPSSWVMGGCGSWWWVWGLGSGLGLGSAESIIRSCICYISHITYDGARSFWNSPWKPAPSGSSALPCSDRAPSLHVAISILLFIVSHPPTLLLLLHWPAG